MGLEFDLVDQTFKNKCLVRLRCLVEGYLGGASNQTNFRVYAAHHHAQETIVILEEGNQTYPRCTKCGMFVSHKALNGRNLMKAFNRWRAERKRNWKGGGGEGSHSLWDPPRPGHFLQLPRNISLGGRKRLAVSGLQPAEGMLEVVKANTSIE